MRQFFNLFFAALFGGTLAALIVVGFLTGREAAPSVKPALAPPPIAPATEPTPVPAYFISNTGQETQLVNTPPDLKMAARRATASAVHITALPKSLPLDAVKQLFRQREDGPSPSSGEGSGVIYRQDGYIITNYHVVRGAGDIQVRTSDRKTYPATLVGEDPKSDLALIKIEGKDFPTLPLANSDQVQPGEWVLAVGNPLGLTSTVTAGIVSAKGRNISLLRGLDAIESFIQTDAAVNPGNSGGPLVTSDGKLLGINTAIASQTGRFQGYSFAIPINLARRVVDDLIEFGNYRRAFLGVGISTLTQSDIKRIGLRGYTEGVLVDEVFKGGSAAAAGIQPNDLIVKVDKRIIRDLPELTEIIGRAKVGETLKVSIIRDGSPLEVIVPMLPATE